MSDTLVLVIGLVIVAVVVGIIYLRKHPQQAAKVEAVPQQAANDAVAALQTLGKDAVAAVIRANSNLVAALQQSVPAPKAAEPSVATPAQLPISAPPPPDPTPAVPAKPAAPISDDVWLPKTGRSFPRPRPDLGEMFIGYVQRVGRVLGLDTSGVGSLFLGTSHLGNVSDAANWPEMADRYFDPRAYMTAEQIEREKAAQTQWREVEQRIRDRNKQERPSGGDDVPIGQE